MKSLFFLRVIFSLGLTFIFLSVLALSTIEVSGYAEYAPVSDQGEVEGVIAFVELDGDIYLLLGDSGERLQLTFDANQYYYNSPKFSPDGQTLAFLKSDPQKGEYVFDLNVMDLGTRQTKQLAENVDEWGGYDWMPDSLSMVYGNGIEIACKSPDQNSTTGIWRVWLETGEIQEFISPQRPNVPLMKPALSYDGAWVSYKSYPCFSEGFKVHTLNISTKMSYEFGFSEMDWAPLENKLALTLDKWAGGSGGLSITSPDQSYEKLLYTAGELSVADPHWSPSGNLLAIRENTTSDGMFVIVEEGEDLIWEDHLLLLNAESGKSQKICSSQEIWGCRFIAWSPIGDQFIYQVSKEKNIDWYLFDLTSNKSFSLPEFGDEGMDWITTNRLPESLFPKPEPTQQVQVTLPTITPDDPLTESSSKIHDSLNPIFIFGGAGLIFLSMILLAILIIVVQKKPK